HHHACTLQPFWAGSQKQVDIRSGCNSSAKPNRNRHIKRLTCVLKEKQRHHLGNCKDRSPKKQLPQASPRAEVSIKKKRWDEREGEDSVEETKLGSTRLEVIRQIEKERGGEARGK